MNIWTRFSGKKSLRWISIFQHIFYICFIVLWFKDNFHPLRNFNLSYLFALVPFLLLTAFRLILRIRRGKLRFPRRISREAAILLALLLAAVAFRIPQLLYPCGMMSSDDAIPALMGKHISEGKVPPICYYGQLYMGSLSSHFFAVMFKIFGYSIFVLRSATILIFLAFVALQYVFVKQVFSSSFALLTAFFFALPLPHLVIVSIDNTSAYALVLLLGTAILYLSYRVAFKVRVNELAPLGFLMGIAFWTHQVTAGFILTALLVLLPKIRFDLRKYFRLGFYALLGFLPQLLVEVFNHFQLLDFLRVGKVAVAGSKMTYGLQYITTLLASNESPLRLVFLILLLLGFFFLVLRSLKNKASRPEAVFSLFSLIFILLYFFSFFSTRQVIRYLYPLYVSLPVLLLSPFLIFRPRLRHSLAFCLVIALFIFFNLQESMKQARLTKDRHLRIADVIKAMRETGKPYWQAEYWTAYLLTSVSKEKPIVASSDIRRYIPYALAYENESKSDNYVLDFRFSTLEKRHTVNLNRWLMACDIGARKMDVGETHLVYDIRTRLLPRVLRAGPPARLPQLELELISSSEGYLRLSFKNVPVSRDVRFKLKCEIPPFSTGEAQFSLKDEYVDVEVPFPAKRQFAVQYYLEHEGIKIPISFREISYVLPAEESAGRKRRLVFLHGLGPEVDYLKKRRRICEKEISFELNSLAAGDLNLRLFLHSPFRFSDWRWYGKYAQEVKIEVNGQFLEERELTDGENVVPLTIPGDSLRPSGNVVTLKFRYHYRFPSLSASPLAALLEKIEFD